MKSAECNKVITFLHRHYHNINTHNQIIFHNCIATCFVRITHKLINCQCIWNYRFIVTCIWGEQEVHIVFQTRDLARTGNPWIRQISQPIRAIQNGDLWQWLHDNLPVTCSRTGKPKTVVKCHHTGALWQYTKTIGQRTSHQRYIQPNDFLLILTQLS